MKILLTGGGTGGHFYPLIAVTEALHRYEKEKKLVSVEIYYMAPEPYNLELLQENNINFVKIPAGKIRRYFSIANFFDLFKTGWGIIKATWLMYWIYPDVVFSKGGYVSIPPLIAAYILRIPIVIHESDSVPGRANAWAGKIAQKVAISYPQAAEYFPKEKVAETGNPVRQGIMYPARDGAHEFLKLQNNVPVLLVLGGSQGSQIINQNILDALAKLVEKYQIIHQVGENNVKETNETANVVLLDSQFKDRYKSYDHLNDLAMRMAAGIADVIVSRAGSTVFEIANWGVPSILIPISDSNGDHQRKNAYSYARTGAAVVIEENNLAPHILISEIDRIMNDAALRGKMRTAALGFTHQNAAELIAAEILTIAIGHEK
ncbi:undecaprenyldiphospho-muramoylpentapeptide beta-N-acetylglucosaminyltransferase [Candidatus Parcubacteria bacterium]|nr:undecaprenyldiphospho-muramoylpentapeptide beta-N-acetylglucosaminyltransferase [Candidatus Parcubacteria bacterium]